MADMTMPTDRNNRAIPIGSSLSSEDVAYTDSAASAVGDYAGKCVRLTSTTDCRYRITGETATAEAPSIKLQADNERYEYVPGDGSISVIQISANGTLGIDLLA